MARAKVRMTSWLHKHLQKFMSVFRVRNPAYMFVGESPTQILQQVFKEAPLNTGYCPSCGKPLVHQEAGEEVWTHNPRTCRLVNITLTELGLSLSQHIRIEILPLWGPLKGYYTPMKPYTIHVSEEAYARYPEYIVFHETKHLVDCVTKGWSEENTPDPFARALCKKYGFKAPPTQVNHPNGNFGIGRMAG